MFEHINCYLILSISNTPIWYFVPTFTPLFLSPQHHSNLYCHTLSSKGEIQPPLDGFLWLIVTTNAYDPPLWSTSHTDLMDSHHHQGKTDNRFLSRRARIEQKGTELYVTTYLRRCTFSHAADATTEWLPLKSGVRYVHSPAISAILFEVLLTVAISRNSLTYSLRIRIIFGLHIEIPLGFLLGREIKMMRKWE